ncbi:hypothetical protein CMK14_20440 [Candidatus Poribacteria bacterium]|nr:hypothetical protein [Candidatus Poribacteria bacterium]
MSLGLGLDTGGTYTDVVLLGFEMERVICKAKALATYPKLGNRYRIGAGDIGKQHPFDGD